MRPRGARVGLDLIVTDHHEPDGTLPAALAVINPKRPDCTYPDKHLAGVGVALKLVQALCQRAGKDKWLPAFVKIAAIGTLADVVPLVGENRVIARLGLASLSRGPHTIGLRSPLDASGLSGKTIDSYQGRVHAGAAGQRGGTDEHAGYRDAAAAGHRRGPGR
jgi:single-stranded-DNA-specific exonuclease